MKKRIIIFNGFFLFITLIILFLGIMGFVSKNIKDKSYEQLNIYSNLISNYFNGDNIDDTISFFNDADIIFSNEVKDINEIYEEGSELKLSIFDDGYYITISIEKNDLVSILNNYTEVGIFFIILIVISSVLLVLALIRYNFVPITIIVNKLGELCDVESIPSDQEELERQIELIKKEIRNRMKDLEYEKRKIEGIFQASNEGIIVVDNNKTIQVINNKALDIFNFNSNVVGNSYLSLLKSREVLNNITLAFDQKFVDRTITFIDNFVYSFSIDDLSNEYINGFLITLTDITTDYNLSKVKKDFFQNASHELKSPLTSIIGYQQLIEQGIYSTKEDIVDGVKSTIKEANKMNKLIIDMLELSELESDIKLETSNINLKVLFIDVIDSLKYFIQEKNINIVLDISDSYQEINIKHATELMKNLIENGIKYNKENCDLEITLTDKHFVVKDYGIGVESKNVDRIFERFYRISNNNKIPGTGLGLAIVKHITSIYDYDISVDSVLSKYTEIKITF